MINWEEQTIVGAGVKQRNKKELPIIIADGLIPVVKESFIRYAKYQTTLRYTHIKVKPLLAAVNKL